MAGFTTERDLGTEGAGYADVGIKQAIDQGIIPGPRMLVATKANVARGAYGPKGFEPGVAIPQGAEEVSGADEMTRAARDQIAAGADVIKMYSDYHYQPGEPSRPTLSEAEMAAGVAIAHDAGRIAAAHATTAEGMRRAVLAGVDTIEHGYGGTPEVFKLMHDRGTALCPTLGASEAYARYFAGWNGQEPAPERSSRPPRIPDGDEGRRADLHGRGCRCLPARRELAGDGGDAARRNVARRNHDRRDLGQRPHSSSRRSRRGEARPACRPRCDVAPIRPGTCPPSSSRFRDEGRGDRQGAAAMTIERRGFLGGGIALLAASAATAQSPAPPTEFKGSANAPFFPPKERFPLWPGSPPGATLRPIKPDWSMDGELDVRGVPVPEVNVFRPARADGSAVLAFPGGGYEFLSVQNEGLDPAERFNAERTTVFVLTYRLPGEGWQNRSLVPLQDAQRAMRLIRSRAA